MSPKKLSYMDLEGDLHDAVNMSEIATTLVEDAQGAPNRVIGAFVISEDEMASLSFAIYHTNKLALALKAKWMEVHNSNGGDA
jgi:hypothetical protein